MPERPAFTRLLDTDSAALEGWGAWLLVIYVFFSGFVFFEPAPAEYVFLLTLPLAGIFLFRRAKVVIVAAALFFVPRILSVLLWRAGGGLPEWRFLLIGAYLFMVFWVFWLVLDRQQDKQRVLRRLFIAWTAAALVNCIAGIYAYVGTQAAWPGVTGFLHIGTRLEGFFKDPNVLGSFMIVPIVYIFDCLLYVRRSKRALVLIAIFSLLVFGLLVSFSRASWLGAFLAVCVLVVFRFFTGGRPVQIRIGISIGAGVLILLVLLALNIPIGGGRNLRTYFLSRIGLEAYDSKRFGAWAAALQLVPQHLFFGSSPGTFEQQYTMSVHNSYIRLLVETGLAGVAATVLMLVYALRRFLQKKIAVGNTQFVLIAGIAGMLAAGIFIDAFHWRHLIMALAMLAVAA